MIKSVQPSGEHEVKIRNQVAILGEDNKEGGDLEEDITNALEKGHLLENENRNFKG